MDNLEKETTKSMSNVEKRNKINDLLKEAHTLKDKHKYCDAEKLYLKSCRMMENIYSQTFSNKDRTLLIECYYQISKFYEEELDQAELVQRWYQKIVGVLQESCDKYFSMDDYRLLLEWFIKTIDLMNDNQDYIHVVAMSSKMRYRARLLYKKTKTDEDTKFVILSEIYLAFAYFKTNKKIYSYFIYNLVAKKMEKIYQKYNDIGMKNDLIDIYLQILKITNEGILKIFNRKWKIKLLLIKGEKI